jgi:hypothetical protein
MKCPIPEFGTYLHSNLTHFPLFYFSNIILSILPKFFLEKENKSYKTGLNFIKNKSSIIEQKKCFFKEKQVRSTVVEAIFF